MARNPSQDCPHTLVRVGKGQVDEQVAGRDGLTSTEAFETRCILGLSLGFSMQGVLGRTPRHKMIVPSRGMFAYRDKYEFYRRFLVLIDYSHLRNTLEIGKRGRKELR